MIIGLTKEVGRDSSSKVMKLRCTVTFTGWTTGPKGKEKEDKMPSSTLRLRQLLRENRDFN